MNRTIWKALRITACAFLLITCVIVAFGCNDSPNFSSQSESTAGDTEETLSAQSLRGTVEEAAMNTLTVRGEDGKSYRFHTEDVEITTGEHGILIGDPVTVTYYGTLDAALMMQEVEIVSISVTDQEMENPNPDNTSSQTFEETTQSDPYEDTIIKQAQAILDDMTLEEKVGQMFIARCPKKNAAQKAAAYHLGGYLLFGRDFEGKSKAEIVQTIQSYQEAVTIPMFIGVDEEGGAGKPGEPQSPAAGSPFLVLPGALSGRGL